MAFKRSTFREQLKPLQLPAETAVPVIAIDRDKNSQCAVKWALENLLVKNPRCVLLHVLGKTLHQEDFKDVSKEGRLPTAQELHQFFLPYHGFCARKGVVAREVVLHDSDIPNALTEYIVRNSISAIVVGASTRNAFIRRFWNPDVPSVLLKSAPESCAVYVISKGKLQTSRTPKYLPSPSTLLVTPRPPQTPGSNAHTPCKTPVTEATTPTNVIRYNLEFPSPPTESQTSEYIPRTDFFQGLWGSESSGTQSTQGNYAFDQMVSFDKDRISNKGIPAVTPTSNKGTSAKTSTDNQSTEMLNRDPESDTADLSGPVSLQLTDISSGSSDFPIDSANSKSSNSASSLQIFDEEMERLRLELKQFMQKYNSVSQEAALAELKARELHQLQTPGQRQLEEAMVDKEPALFLAEKERQKNKLSIEAAKMTQRLVEVERQNAEGKAKQQAEERIKEMQALAKRNVKCRIYTIEEIEEATDRFNVENKIGEGGYGPVFKGVIDHTDVAIKVLRPDFSQGQRQFLQEVEVLSSIRHPNMVILLGACPAYGCLVYEYMDNGNLEDRLLRKNDTDPIPWRNRFKIASEISTALLFLHETKPEPVVHRDLKPANILLNRDCLSKISDVGLARLVPPSVADNVTRYRLTAAAGTFCYIDPEYQQTGKLTVKSDLYSLGILLLQIITAKSPMGLSFQVEQAIKNGKFSDMLDPAVTDWPVKQALSLAKLALKCCELRMKDRPSLGSVVVPELNRLRDFALASKAGEHEPILLASCPRDSDPLVHTETNQGGMGSNSNPKIENSNVDQSKRRVAASSEDNDQTVEL
ncbi:hypothetical protein K2173_024556 [Erythroxylum novogranatense]|uniref:RING-type E3 ubiquitin transferase n=1 Tax=Erythroxylum novogranatense TaxID=1862640 RepID=A0AAV8SUP7_9ROSI|nr:hypothetical protein K2173_024556 [Erythroxylum novogranatense]